MGRSNFYGKAIESSEYLDDHLAWLGITIGLRSESITDKWSQTGQDRCGQKSAWGYSSGVLPSNVIRHQWVQPLRADWATGLGRAAL